VPTSSAHGWTETEPPRRGHFKMTTETKIRGITGTDRIVLWALLAGLATVLLQYAEAAALPAHFV
jgi:hypothetical protein